MNVFDPNLPAQQVHQKHRAPGPRMFFLVQLVVEPIHRVQESQCRCAQRILIKWRRYCMKAMEGIGPRRSSVHWSGFWRHHFEATSSTSKWKLLGEKQNCTWNYHIFPFHPFSTFTPTRINPHTHTHKRTNKGCNRATWGFLDKFWWDSLTDQVASHPRPTVTNQSLAE